MLCFLVSDGRWALFFLCISKNCKIVVPYVDIWFSLSSSASLRSAPQAVLIVNVASHCGYTDSHYRELQALRENYDEDELAIIAFPSNQFGAQEPGTWGEIVSFVDRQYGVTFPIMGKVI